MDETQRGRLLPFDKVTVLGAAERKMGRNYLSQVGTEGSPDKVYSGGLVSVDPLSILSLSQLLVA